MAVKRVWHGWTTLANAEKYRRLLLNEVFAGIEAMNMEGYRGIELMRREVSDEVEFVTTMTFDTLQDVINFQGEDYTRAYVPEAAQRLLKRWDTQSAHFQVVESRQYDRWVGEKTVVDNPGEKGENRNSN